MKEVPNDIFKFGGERVKSGPYTEYLGIGLDTSWFSVVIIVVLSGILG